ncbi:MAG: Minf_1886 family protein [Verrucomicrobiota bacterium]
MRKITFEEAVAQILTENPRYAPESYYFIREALDWTTRSLKKPIEGPGRHVSAAELLEGIRQFALKEYGPMALTVLQSWGIRQCADFGQIVFNLVNKKFLGKTDDDSVHDFDHGYDFVTAFRAPFEPEQKKKCGMQNEK